MSVSAHVMELRKKHENLSMQVEEAERAPSVDALHVSNLKKQKLKLKEEIERLST